MAPPTWDKDVAPLFAAPFWLPEDQRVAVGQTWNSCMMNFGLDLTVESDVKAQAADIYSQLSSKSMPQTSDPNQLWPQAALDTFKAWMDAGPTPVAPAVTPTNPVNPTPNWTDDVMNLFALPYW
jgi:hypothetical protein